VFRWTLIDGDNGEALEHVTGDPFDTTGRAIDRASLANGTLIEVARYLNASS